MVAQTSQPDRKHAMSYRPLVGLCVTDVDCNESSRVDFRAERGLIQDAKRWHELIPKDN